MNRKDTEDAITGEVANWPGADVAFVEGRKHPKAKLHFDGSFYPVTFSGTPGSSLSIHHTLADIRRGLRKLGATRTKPEPTREEDEAPYRKPNDGADKRPDPTGTGPVADPEPTLAEKAVAAGLLTPEAAAAALAVAKASAVVAAPKAVDFEDDEEGDDSAEAEEAARATIMEAAAAVVDGIYFGLPEKVYHAVPRLGSSGLGDLLVSAGTFWNESWLDPNRPELDLKSTPAQIIGKAYHCARLEPDRFEIEYARKPSAKDFPAKGLLRTDTAVKAKLKSLDQTQTIKGETMGDRAARLADLGYPGVILPLVMANFEMALAARDPKPYALDADIYDDIERDIERMKAVPDVAELMVGGASEVSIFWTDANGMKFKCRPDYLTAHHWSDFKTFANPNGKELDQCLTDAFRFNGYYMQAAHYRDGAEAMRVGGLEIIGECSDYEREMVEAIRARPQALACWYIYQEKGGVPNLVSRRVRFHGVDAWRENEIALMLDDPQQRIIVETAMGQKTGLYTRALMDLARAKAVFAMYSAVYQPGEPWGPIEPVGSHDDGDFNAKWLAGEI